MSETYGPLTYFNITMALNSAAQLEEGEHYEIRLTGNGYVLTFYDELNVGLFAIGLAHMLGYARALKAFRTFRMSTLADSTGVDLVLTGSYVGV